MLSFNIYMKLVLGDPKYKVPPLAPFNIEQITINQGDERTVNLKMNLTNVYLHGLENAEMTKSE